MLVGDKLALDPVLDEVMGHLTGTPGLNFALTQFAPTWGTGHHGLRGPLHDHLLRQATHTGEPVTGLPMRGDGKFPAPESCWNCSG